MAIGLDVKEPEGNCEDPNCPFHGQLPIRGRTFEGKVDSKNGKTVTVKWQYYHKVPKYERFMRKNTKVMAHLPPCMDVDEGDEVRIGETRPISKGKSFVVIESSGDNK